MLQELHQLKHEAIEKDRQRGDVEQELVRVQGELSRAQEALEARDARLAQLLSGPAAEESSPSPMAEGCPFLLHWKRRTRMA